MIATVLMESPDDPARIILDAPMSPYQVRAVGVTAALCALDGFDVLAVGIAAPGIVKDWGVGNAALGIVFSTGLAGMALGSFTIAPLADRIGRRRVIFASLTLMTLGMFLTADASNVITLMICRLLTGLGIGAMISVIYPLSAEYANARRRDLCVSVTAVGYAVGGVIGGAAAAALLAHHSWRWVFLFGAVVGLTMIPLVYFGLPESVPYLVGCGDRTALARINVFLSRCGFQSVSGIAAGPAREPRLALGEIFRAEAAVSTLQITAVNLLTFMSAYYLMSWIPQNVARLGFTASQAARVSVMASLGGIVGSVALGWASTKVGLKPLVLATIFGMAVMVAMFGFTPPKLDLLTWAAAVAGMFVYASTTGIYALLTRTFSARTRATGVGFVVGVGRVSSALGPAIAGLLLASGLSYKGVGATMAVPVLIAAAILMTLRVRSAAAR